MSARPARMTRTAGVCLNRRLFPYATTIYCLAHRHGAACWRWRLTLWCPEPASTSRWAPSRSIETLAPGKGLTCTAGSRCYCRPTCQPAPPSRPAMTVARDIVENRVNGLGVTEPLVQRQGANRIVVELPGVTDPQQAIDTLKQTGLLEFVDIGSLALSAEDQVIQTDCWTHPRWTAATQRASCRVRRLPIATETVGSTLSRQHRDRRSDADDRRHSLRRHLGHDDSHGHSLGSSHDWSRPATISRTGRCRPRLSHRDDGRRHQDATVGRTQLGEWSHQLQPDRMPGLDDFRRAYQRQCGQAAGHRPGQDRHFCAQHRAAPSPPARARSAAVLHRQSANQLALQLRYGSLPVPLKVVQSREIGPSLGQDSLRKSAIAGIIGLSGGVPVHVAVLPPAGPDRRHRAADLRE